ncbi:hypothetical protein ACG873_29935 [Mesorhizobium sp. AaZ16]
MALFLFTGNILAGKPIAAFNHGEHKRNCNMIPTRISMPAL